MGKKLRQKNKGYAIIVLTVILGLSTAIALFGLRSSQHRTKKAGIKGTVTELKYESERGLQKAVQRIQAIADGQDTAVPNANGSSAYKDISFLVGDLALGSILTEADTNAASGSDPNLPCDSNTQYPFDQFRPGSLNVICNFLGAVEPTVQVSLVRKNDLNDSGNIFGIFLINAIALDGNGRRQITQGVVAVPYSRPTPADPPVFREMPYLTNSKTVVD